MDMCGYYNSSMDHCVFNTKRGVIKDMYHYPLLPTIDRGDGILGILRETLLKYTRPIKINVVFGFILRERLTDELRFFHPSANIMLFELPKLIQNADDRKNLEEDVERLDVLEYAIHQRPSAKWIVDRITCVRFDIYKLR